jgi:hypothetical protein
MDTGHFTGTEQWHRHSLNRNVTFTDGAKYVFDTASAYWLLDMIALCMYRQNFQVWTLEVENDVGTITVTDGNELLIDTLNVPYTTFPAPGVTLWFIDGVILVPSEY